MGIAALGVVVLDQITKQLALDRLQDEPHPLIEGVVTLRLTYNSGGAFGLGRGLPWLFLIATTIVIAVVLVLARRATMARTAVPLGLVVGGGLGNMADRLLRDLNGGVVDFIDLHVWPVFNLADAAIVVGAGLLLLGSRAEEGGSEEGS